MINILKSLPQESEWVEFKQNNSNPQKTCEYISALSNSAYYYQKEYSYLLFGMKDSSHDLVRADFYTHKAKIDNQELENWLATQLMFIHIG